jgi:hypothetical protein
MCIAVYAWNQLKSKPDVTSDMLERSFLFRSALSFLVFSSSSSHVLYLFAHARSFTLIATHTLPSCRRYRWYMTWKGEFAAMAVASVPGLIIFLIYIITYGDTIGWSEPILSAARCEWWDFNPAVVSAAAAKGIDVTAPTAANPNGYAPYSVHYASCKFCGFSQNDMYTVRTRQHREMDKERSSG